MGDVSGAVALVLGGCGFIGRNIVAYLHEECGDKVSLIVVVDKSMPALSNFGPKYDNVFKSDRVKYMQGDVSRSKTVDKIFAAHKYEFVFNAAAETRLSLPEVQYEAKVLNLAKLNAEAAAKNGVKRFIHLSTCRVYGGSKSKKPHKETTKAAYKPWTTQAVYSLKAENAVMEAASGTELDVCILRPANVYGPGDVTTNGIMGRAVVAAVYFQLNEKMKVLWSKELKVNTVHVDDVCRAMWHLASSSKNVNGFVFNLVDSTSTNQGILNSYLARMFGIKASCIGQFASNIARVAIKTVTNAANDRHMAPWSALCAHHSVKHSPLSPFVDPELLRCNHLYADGSAIEVQMEFTYSHPDFTEELFRGMVESAIEAGVFPPVLQQPNEKK